MEAAHHGQLSAAKLLVQYGADVDVANQVSALAYKVLVVAVACA
jgi:predicted Fe-Mo cluster-binding NifX family protein